MIGKFALLGLLFSLLSGAVHAATLGEAKDAYLEGNYQEALSAFRKIAGEGVPEAQYLLAFMIDNGRGIEADPVTATKLYRQAAAGGNPEAQFELGIRYRDGTGGVKVSLVKAEMLLFEATLQGLVEAQDALALLSLSATPSSQEKSTSSGDPMTPEVEVSTEIAKRTLNESPVRIEEMKKQLARLQHEKQELGLKLAHAELQSAKLASELEQSQQSREGAALRVQNQEIKSQALQDALNDLEGKLSLQELEVKSRETELWALRKSVEASDRFGKELSIKVKNQLQDIEKKQKEILNLNSSIAQLEAKLKQQNELLEMARQEAFELRKLNQELSQNLSQLHKENEQLQTQQTLPEGSLATKPGSSPNEAPEPCSLDQERAIEKIGRYASSQWPDDIKMQEYEYERQLQAYADFCAQLVGDNQDLHQRTWYEWYPNFAMMNRSYQSDQ